MALKETKLYSIFFSKCPQCRKGNLFKNKISFNILNTTTTKTRCEVCNLKYMREPSFFYGAMYVGYGLSVAIGIILYIVGTLLLNLEMLQSIWVISLGLILVAPWSLRLARTIWIYLFIRYQKNPSKWVK